MRREQHDVGQQCACVSTHTPAPQELHIHHILPLAMGGLKVADNEIWLCPTSHVNVHELLRAWVKHEGEPPWEVRRRFSLYIRGLAERGYREATTQTVA